MRLLQTNLKSSSTNSIALGSWCHFRNGHNISSSQELSPAQHRCHSWCVCLIVYISGVFLQEFPVIWRRHNQRWKASVLTFTQHDHWAVGFFYHATPTVMPDIGLLWSDVYQPSRRSFNVNYLFFLRNKRVKHFLMYI